MTVRDTSSFAQLLRNLRLAHGLSQEALAERSGLSADAIRALERGRRTAPRASTLALLADALALTPDDRAALASAAEPERPARAVASSPVPLPPDPLIGRERELAEIAACFSGGTTRLVTLTGPGGVGKTRLALEVLAADRAGGVFVDLAAVRDPALVPMTIVHAASGPDTGPRDPWQRLLETLGTSDQIFVLDNFEHLVDAAPAVSDLLAAAPGVRVLVTSRAPLRLRGEQRFPVRPLDASPGADGAAARLFIARARAVEPDFAPDDSTLPTIATICQRLDGLPLAIELATAQLRMLTLDDLSDRLDQRLPLLTGGGRDLPARHQTIRATIAWSYDQLTAAEQRFFRQMAVFVGGFTLAAAEDVASAAGGDLDAMTGIAALVDHSLVRLLPGERAARYLMLETIREFGLEQLAASGEDEAVRAAHARAMTAHALLVMPELDVHPSYDAVAGLDRDIGNLRAALGWLAGQGRADDLATLVLRSRWLWYFSYVAEGLGWYELLLATPAIAAHPELAALLREAGQLATTLDPTSAAGLAYLERARALFQAAGDLPQAAETTLRVGIAAEDAGDPATAAAHFHAARALWEDVSYPEGLAVVDYHLGIVAYGQGDLTGAAALLDRASATAAEIGDRMVATWCSWYQALVACAQGAPARAAMVLGETHREAARALSQSLHWPTHFAAAAVLAAALGDDEAAARLVGAVMAEHEHDPLDWPESATVARTAAAVRARLGAEAFETSRQTGASLTAAGVVAEIDQVLARARTAGAGSTPPTAAPASPSRPGSSGPGE